MPQESVLISEPRWPAALALLSVGGLYYALPPELRVGPDWLVLMLVAALVIPATISHHRGNWRLSHFLGYAANSVVTLSVAISLGLLISRLPAHKDKRGAHSTTMVRSLRGRPTGSIPVIEKHYN